MRGLSERERKLLAVLILVAGLAAVHLLVVAPIAAGFRERSMERQTLLREIAYNQRLIASIPRLRRTAERQQAALGSFVISAPSSAQASTLLQERLQAVIDQNGGEVRALADAAAPPGFVGAQVSARLDLAQLTRALSILQNQQPYVTIEGLTVSADDALISGRPGPLDVNIETSIPYSPAAA